MTDLEISKALALKIGWCEADFKIDTGGLYMCLPYQYANIKRYFSFKDWNVIGPIAERFDCFPWQGVPGIWEAPERYANGVIKRFVRADTPQKAIALAVIGGVR